MKARLSHLYLTYANPRTLRLAWFVLALVALALAGGAPDGGGIGGGP